jgi:thiol-disulfide isomerase/thioredoxin
MMRTMLLAFALAGLAGTGTKADEKPDATKKLKVGDPAPKLTVTKYLQGDEVKSFEKDKVYVVEFWATWCGPCIVMMPHLADLAEEMKEKGVTVIGFTSKASREEADKAAAFVKKRGPKLGYRFAWEDGSETNDAWMKAAGQAGIPCSFVVDKAGKIAFIGHPMYLDVVLPKVVDGTWKAEDAGAEIKKIETEVNGVFKAIQGADKEAALKALTGFEKKNPGLAKIPYFTGPKLSLLIGAGKIAEARKMAEGVIASAAKRGDSMALRTVSAALRTKEASADKDNAALALKAAEAMVKMEGEKDARALFNLAETHFALGNKDKAIEFGAKAVENAEGELKAAIKKQVERYEVKNKEA